MLPFKTILYATDFSPPSRVAFEVAASLARDYRALLVAVHVIEPARVGFSEFGSYIGPEEDGPEALEKLRELHSPSSAVAIEHRIVEGYPADEIVNTAKSVSADLIIVGTHGRSGFSRLLMGSVAEELLRKAPCPVMTVRGDLPIVHEVIDEIEIPEALSI